MISLPHRLAVVDVHHTQRDRAALVAAGVAPESTQGRENRVPCRVPGCRAWTFNQAGGCDGHYLAPRVARLVEPNRTRGET